MTKTSADKTKKSLVTSPKSTSQETITAVTVEAPASLLSVTADKTTEPGKEGRVSGGSVRLLKLSPGQPRLQSRWLSRP